MNEKLDIALREYELATQHYFHEDKMKTDALKNSLFVIIAIFAAITAVISIDKTANFPSDKVSLEHIKMWFIFALGLSGIFISISYGIQYRRILKHQEARLARLEELERIIEDMSHFPIRIIGYGLELIKQNKLDIPQNKFVQHIELGKIENTSSSKLFKFLVPWFPIILWIVSLGLLFLIHIF